MGPYRLKRRNQSSQEKGSESIDGKTGRPIKVHTEIAGTGETPG